MICHLTEVKNNQTISVLIYETNYLFNRNQSKTFVQTHKEVEGDIIFQNTKGEGKYWH